MLLQRLGRCPDNMLAPLAYCLTPHVNMEVGKQGNKGLPLPVLNLRPHLTPPTVLPPSCSHQLVPHPPACLQLANNTQGSGLLLQLLLPLADISMHDLAAAMHTGDWATLQHMVTNPSQAHSLPLARPVHKGVMRCSGGKLRPHAAGRYLDLRRVLEMAQGVSGPTPCMICDQELQAAFEAIAASTAAAVL